ncbi:MULTISPECIES: DUF3011 domain-containing protein [Stenotrophomonas]|uniref:DUF3011 domain-containing protein n=1 Tax=Stenotrophomonas sp. CFBP8994 TaxID=3096527 RepID=UPI002A6B7C58|nr:DUF3011 domain-containing protein [Stenotrophomonas sp. CFBP8994]MDY0979298.1 DUF3011 domain-containing protein [Stenotrophomonas sp. CFBP8994]
MQTRLLLGTPLLLLATLTDVRADDFVTCESRDNRYQSCALPYAGYVTLDRKLSGADCRQGRSWDYDRRNVWVDDGCRASFRVRGDDRHHGRDDDNHDAKVAAGVLVGAAILGALVHNANKQDERYDDGNYQGARHTSYVPQWMVGEFEGYNPMYNTDIRMRIEADGRMSAQASGQNLSGWVNGGQLNVGSSVFDINQSRDGFVTTEVGDRQNEVRYRRVR